MLRVGLVLLDEVFAGKLAKVVLSQKKFELSMLARRKSF